MSRIMTIVDYEVKPQHRNAFIDISGQHSKSTAEYAGERFDYAITVCDDAKEACPYFPGANKQVHWRFDDPASASGSEDERLAVYRRVRNEISAAIDEFVAAEG